MKPIEATLKAPGIKRLKLELDVLISSFAFKFNLRRYTLVTLPTLLRHSRSAVCSQAGA